MTQSIVPAVTAELKVCVATLTLACCVKPLHLQELERQRKIEEAMVHRKRSSRIAMKESEKEEARMAAIKRAEEDEKEARAKRAEARAKKEQAEREKRENAREQRRLDREEREERARRKEERDRARKYVSKFNQFFIDVVSPCVQSEALKLSGKVEAPLPQAYQRLHRTVIALPALFS